MGLLYLFFLRPYAITYALYTDSSQLTSWRVRRIDQLIEQKYGENVRVAPNGTHTLRWHLTAHLCGGDSIWVAPNGTFISLWQLKAHATFVAPSGTFLRR
jgi:hypothetical protein